jgi:AraC family transcriptional activator of mtrCDE
MDLLSKFLSLHPVTTTLDWRCELSAPWRLVNHGTAFGRVPYHLIVEGSAWLELQNKEKLPLDSGDILMLPHGTPHTLHSGNSDAPLPEVLPATITKLGNLKTAGTGVRTEVLCGEFVLNPRRSNLLLQALPDIVLLKTQNSNLHQQLFQLLQMLKQESQQQSLGSSIIAEHLSSVLFSLLVRGWIREAEWGGNLLKLLTEPRLSPATEHLLSNPEQVLSLSAMASLCHMSRATFIRLFKQATGQSPAALMTAIRLMQAAKLLASSNLSVGTISTMVGYASEPAFHRAFKEKMGASPGEFRRSQLT